jgi:hypothetical protein
MVKILLALRSSDRWKLIEFGGGFAGGDEECKHFLITLYPHCISSDKIVPKVLGSTKENIATAIGIKIDVVL